jgi:hypothetical protein
LRSVGASGRARLHWPGREAGSGHNTLAGPIQSDAEGPTIIVFVEESDELSSSKLKLVFHRRFEVELDAVNRGASWATSSHNRCGTRGSGDLLAGGNRAHAILGPSRRWGDGLKRWRGSNGEIESLRSMVARGLALQAADNSCANRCSCGCDDGNGSAIRRARWLRAWKLGMRTKRIDRVLALAGHRAFPAAVSGRSRAVMLRSSVRRHTKSSGSTGLLIEASMGNGTGGDSGGRNSSSSSWRVVS